MRDYSYRQYAIFAIFFLIALIYLCRLFYIQIIDDSYKLSADNNVLRYEVQYPVRGLIYDRNGRLLVYNQPAFDLMVIPKLVKDIDDTIGFCSLLGITQEQYGEKMQKAKKYSRYKPSVFEKQLSVRTFGKFQEKMYKFPGFFVQPRTVRHYPRKSGANVLGNIGEADPALIARNPYYLSGDYVGKSGVEKSYEKILRGRRGVKVYVVDVHNRIKGNFAEGRYDSLPVAGHEIHLTLDGELQEYGELLMQNKKGSIVAIEPATGEVLALVSSPGYDPNLLVGRERGMNFALLRQDSLQPLFDRALMAQYPPGSTFKIMQALIALQEGVITPGTMFPCNKQLINCHNHPNPLDVHGSVQHSCNPYYYMVFKRLIDRHEETRNVGTRHASSLHSASKWLQIWYEYAQSFGFGVKLNIDIPSEQSGFIPPPAYYNKVYGEGRWRFATIYSLGIGQGEVLAVPLQLANFTTIIANRGYYYAPHITRNIQGEEQVKHTVPVDRDNFELIAEGMQDVVKSGTARRAQIDSITVCGKTGTAENPHGEDHSLFIAFAPKDNPKIAISVVVENSGFGGTWAAPVAGLMIEKYITRSVKNKEEEKRIIETDFIHY